MWQAAAESPYYGGGWFHQNSFYLEPMDIFGFGDDDPIEGSDPEGRDSDALRRYRRLTSGDWEEELPQDTEVLEELIEI